MADELILRRDLVRCLNNIKPSDWERATNCLGLVWSNKYGKGSHGVMRDPKYPDPSDTRGRVTTIQKNLYKEANISIFKNLRKKGIDEDKIWRCLGMLE
ncbi:MAG: hypothetical protein V1656_01035 [Candidatus Jorgensenbacteria bacterium]